MKVKSFSPLLAPNESIDLNEIKFPFLASKKLDGCRIIFYKGQMLSRSLKSIPNKQLKERFEPLRKFSEDNNCIIDGEGYSPNLNFQSIIHYVMTIDLEKEKLPEDLKFYIF